MQHAHNDPLSQVAELKALVLAGGKSSRMGQNKALLPVHGIPQYAHLLDLLSHHATAVFISCKAGQESTYPATGARYLTDAPETAGPLAGIMAAFAYDPHAAWLVVACDLVLLDDDVLAELMRARQPQRVATCFRSGFDSLPEPLVAIWEPNAVLPIIQARAEGLQCPRKILMRSDVCLVDASDTLKLSNANTPEDLRSALKR
jgi:molybdopterin-guanine dinucleotide biosynthesis protein A